MLHITLHCKYERKIFLQLKTDNLQCPGIGPAYNIEDGDKPNTRVNQNAANGLLGETITAASNE